MKIIELTDRKIYRADKGKKVRFVGDEKPYSEISVDIEDKREVEEADNGNV